MRILTIIGALAASTLLGGWGFDQQGPYCHYERNFTNCGYPSFAACLAAASGVGGWCAPNPKYVEPRYVEPRLRRSKSW